MWITDEINWSPLDFIIMGSLITTSLMQINLLLITLKNSNNKTLYIGILVLIFLLIWAELSVGIFDSPIAGN